MMDVLTTIKDYLWDYILLFGLIGIGIYMSIRLRFPQVTRLFPSIGKLFRDIKNKVPVQEGRMTPFQSLATAIAAQVGTGNIVGVATAIASGGPGAAFWMMLSAFSACQLSFPRRCSPSFIVRKRMGTSSEAPPTTSKGNEIEMAFDCVRHPYHHRARDCRPDGAVECHCHLAQ